MTSFSALYQTETTSTLWIPPDTDGAVGIGYVMTALNTQVRLQTLTGTTVTTTVLLNDFWSSVGDGSDVCDPHVLFDPFNKRWMFTAITTLATGNHLLIGVSQTADPTGNWYLFSVNGSPTAFADYPLMGFNKNWITVQANMFPNSGSVYVNIYVFNKSALYNDITGTTFYTLITDTTNGFSMAPSISYDTTSSTMYLLEDWTGTTGLLRLSTITGTVGHEVLNVGVAYPAMAPWVDPPSNSVGLPQSGTSTTIDSNDTRMCSLIYRNGYLWGTHHIYLPVSGPPYHTAIQWFQLSTTGSVIQYGLINDPTGTTSYAFPSLAVNAQNDVLIGYSRFSPDQYASADYSFRLSTDPTGTTESDYMFKAGQDIYNITYGSGRNRWGDYSCTMVDPANDLDMWTIQEYAGPYSSTVSSAVWGTWWAHIAVTTPLLPVITSLNPTSTAAGGGGFTLTVSGKNFSDGASGVRWNGISLTTTFVSTTALVATVPASYIATNAAETIAVVNAGPGGGTSNEMTFNVTAPTPAMASLSPASVTAGGKDFTLTVTGTGFINGTSSIQLNGTGLNTAFVTPTVLTASVPASDISTAGNAAITVVSTPPGGGTSNALNLTIKNQGGGSSKSSGCSCSTDGGSGTGFDPLSIVLFLLWAGLYIAKRARRPA